MALSIPKTTRYAFSCTNSIIGAGCLRASSSLASTYSAVRGASESVAASTIRCKQRDRRWGDRQGGEGRCQRGQRRAFCTKGAWNSKVKSDLDGLTPIDVEKVLFGIKRAMGSHYSKGNALLMQVS